MYGLYFGSHKASLETRGAMEMVNRWIPFLQIPIYKSIDDTVTWTILEGILFLLPL